MNCPWCEENVIEVGGVAQCEYCEWNENEYGYECSIEACAFGDGETQCDECKARWSEANRATWCRHGIDMPDLACGICRKSWSLDMVSKVTGRVYGPAPVTAPSGLTMNQVFVTTPKGNPRERYDAEDAAAEWAARGSSEERTAEYEARDGQQRVYQTTPQAEGIVGWDVEAKDAEALAAWHREHDKLTGRVVERDYAEVVPLWWKVYERGQTPTWPGEPQPGDAEYITQWLAETQAYLFVEPGEVTPAQWRAAGRPAHVMS